MTTQHMMTTRFEQVIDNASKRFGVDPAYYGNEGTIVVIEEMKNAYGSVEAFHLVRTSAEKDDESVVEMFKHLMSTLHELQRDGLYQNVSEHDVDMHVRYYFGTDA